MEDSPTFGNQSVVQCENFFGGMAFTGNASVDSLAELSLPLRIVLFGATTNIIHQLKTVIERKVVHSVFEFCDTHW
jgi:hypothetical protein